MKRKKKTATEVHSTPRHLNSEAQRRVVTNLPVSIVVKCKTLAYQQGITMTKFLAQIITNNVKG